MNYAGFKKVKEDDHKAVLKNKHGHELTISKKALSPKHLKGLQELPLYAAGGSGPVTDPNETSAGAAIKLQDVAIDARDAEEKQNIDANQPKKLIDNTPATDTSNPNPQEKSPVQIFVGAQPPQQPSGPNNILSNTSGGTPQAPTNANVVAPSNNQPTENGTPDEEPSDAVPTGATQQNAPIQPPIPGDQFVKEMRDWGQDQAGGKVQAKTYADLLWKNPDGTEKSGIGKVGALFGLLISGAGSGLAHQPNMVMQMMDNEIAKDLESQKATRTNQLDFGKLVDAHLLNQSQTNKNQADISHLALSDEVVRNEFKQGLARRAYLDKLYKNIQSTYPPNSPQLQKSMQALGMLSSGLDARDQSAAALINSRWELYKNAMEEQTGGQSSANGPINYNKFNQLERNQQMKIPGAPSTEDIGQATKEAATVEDVSELRKTYNKAFDTLDKSFLAKSLTPGVRAAVINTMIGKIQKASAGRFNLQDARMLAESMFPAVGDWASTKATKKEYSNSLFDSMASGTPTLNRFRLKNEPQQSQAQPSLTGDTVRVTNQHGQQFDLPRANLKKALSRGYKELQ